MHLWVNSRVPIFCQVKYRPFILTEFSWFTLVSSLYSTWRVRQYICKLEEGMATHSSTLAYRIPWTEEPGRLQSIGSQSLTLCDSFTFTNKSFLDESSIKIFTLNPSFFSNFLTPYTNSSFFISLSFGNTISVSFLGSALSLSRDRRTGQGWIEKQYIFCEIEAIFA